MRNQNQKVARHQNQKVARHLQCNTEGCIEVGTWMCKTCLKWFCNWHQNESDKGPNVECAGCEGLGKTRAPEIWEPTDADYEAVINSGAPIDWQRLE
jgi:hypothetical protein